MEEQDVALFIHMPFQVQLKPEPWTVTAKKVLEQHLDFAEAVGSPGVVLHVTRYNPLGVNAGIEAMLKNIASLTPRTKTKLLIETSSGSKSTDHLDVWQLIDLIDNAPEWVGWCYDTAHVYADGTDVFNEEGAIEALMSHPKLGLVHLNCPDPKVKLGSKLDRHNCAFGDDTSITREQARTLVDLNSNNVPCILERRDMDAVRTDFRYLKDSYFEDLKEISQRTYPADSLLSILDTMKDLKIEPVND
jgi:endonuclease IV